MTAPKAQEGIATLDGGTAVVSAHIAAPFGKQRHPEILIQTLSGKDSRTIDYAILAGERTPGYPGSFVLRAIDRNGRTNTRDRARIRWTVEHREDAPAVPVWKNLN